MAATLMADGRWQMADGRARGTGVAISEAANPPKARHQAKPAIRHPPSAIRHL